MSSGVAYGGSVAALSLAQDCQASSANTTFGRLSFHDDTSALKPHKAFKGKGRAAPDQDNRASAEKILRAFNTWSFKREQPSDAQLMLRSVADAVAAQKPLRFVLYWGKGPRCNAAGPERECLDFLAALTGRVADVYAPGAALTLILTDTHAELNGHGRSEIGQYFADVKEMAEQRGFETCWLGQLVKAARIAGSVMPVEEDVTADMLARLVGSAEKWYRGPGTAQDGALVYLRMNLFEQRVVERAFPGSIFVTFNGSELRALFPRHLPIFYMYSLRRGVAVKPWFLPCEPAKSESNAAQANPLHPAAR